ncbi:unnamed protein product [Soboliphyme baturini]|uniref:PTPRK n=1 Tax=Soboliphyme baturini TaxID=241478 RepID=A0A183IWA6_9BILA|nr:unnamed protein product [Soboliphyme baturini]
MLLAVRCFGKESVKDKLLETQNIVKLEFDNIPKRRLSAGFQTAQRPENHRRNRYKHILPYEDTRVVLRSTKSNAFGYINASNVLVKFGKHSLRYVASQAPMRATAVDFWQMVWESGCFIIVMLTACVENGVDLCYQYWPRMNTEGKVMRFGDYAVTLSNCIEAAVHVFSSLRLKHLPTNQQRLIYHFQYLDWPRGGTPRSLTSYLGFLDEISGMRRHVENQSALMNLSAPGFPFYEATPEYHPELGCHISDVSPPVLVHCNSGVGRTGVYLLSDIMIYSIEHNLEFDLPSVLAMLRQQRMNFVDTYEQYLFVYQCLEEHIRHSRLV